MRKASEGTFPKELLEASVDEKVAYFHHSKIDHPTIHRAKEAILRAIRAPGPEKLIFAYGPTGVGKTTLMISIMETIIACLKRRF
jgi:DNA replication protein DnaC